MPPYRIEWLDEAKADIRAMDRITAMRIFEGILRFSHSGTGDITTLQGILAGSFSAPASDYRVLLR